MSPAGRLAAAAAVAATMVAGAVIGRGAVVELMPGAAPLYSAIGLPARAPGLDFSGVSAVIVGSGSDAALVVEGEIGNASPAESAVPMLELSVRNAGGRAFYTWTSEPPRRTLAASETARFRARLAAPPTEGTQVLVRFASARNGAGP